MAAYCLARISFYLQTERAKLLCEEDRELIGEILKPAFLRKIAVSEQDPADGEPASGQALEGRAGRAVYPLLPAGASAGGRTAAADPEISGRAPAFRSSALSAEYGGGDGRVCLYPEGSGAAGEMAAGGRGPQTRHGADPGGIHFPMQGLSAAPPVWKDGGHAPQHHPGDEKIPHDQPERGSAVPAGCPPAGVWSRKARPCSM